MFLFRRNNEAEIAEQTKKKELAMQDGISLSKNPLYLAGEKTMEIRTVQEIPEEMKDRFHKEIGLYLRKKI
ncbi:MAG: hypothetical protein SOZ08_05770 [Erysipelotrichaceae bacterium]|nr:hypothetical protein [Erysipelotrichaceae bacterium]